MKQFLFFDRLFAGLNGSDGHMRANNLGVKKKIGEIQLSIRSFKPRPLPHPGPVNVAFVRYCRRKLDRDNAMSSCKHVLDALVREGLIGDDSDRFLCRLEVFQVVIKKHQRTCTTVIIEDADMATESATEDARLQEWLRTG